MVTGVPRKVGVIDGIDVFEIDLEASDASIRGTILTWGAVLKDLEVRLADGNWRRVVLGFDKLDDYIAHSPHFGAIAGQYANRIAQGRFTLDGIEYQLPLNQDGKHSLHGGGQGFGKRPWKVTAWTESAVDLQCMSPAGDAGYPGTLTTMVRYKLTGAGTLHIEMSALTDAPTIVNLCHHSYFNLAGSADILGHSLQVDAGLYTVVDDELIPNGEIRAVEGTPFDRREIALIARPDPADPSRPFRTDHNFVLHRRISGPADAGPNRTLHRAATLLSPQQDLTMAVWTDAPGLQVYDGHKVNTPVPGLSGAPYGPFAGICLESQNFPDAPNHAHFPGAVLRPGEQYRHVVEYRFTP